MSDFTTPLSETDLEALRAQVAADGDTIEESREDDGYHVIVTWADGAVETFLAEV